MSGGELLEKLTVTQLLK